MAIMFDRRAHWQKVYQEKSFRVAPNYHMHPDSKGRFPSFLIALPLVPVM